MVQPAVLGMPLSTYPFMPLCSLPCLCSVFTCKLQSKTVDAYGTSHIRCSRLHLVDLAGANTGHPSGAVGRTHEQLHHQYHIAEHVFQL